MKSSICALLCGLMLAGSVGHSAEPPRAWTQTSPSSRLVIPASSTEILTSWAGKPGTTNPYALPVYIVRVQVQLSFNGLSPEVMQDFNIPATSLQGSSVWDLGGLEEGEYELKTLWRTPTTAIGQWAGSSVTKLYVDLNPPMGELTRTSDSFAVAASDSIGLSQVQLQTDSGKGYATYKTISVATSPGTRLFKQTYTLPSIVGKYSLRARISDHSGRVVTTKPILVVPDPVASITTISAATENVTGLKASVVPQTGSTYAWTLDGNGSLTSAADKNAITFRAGNPGLLTLQCVVTNLAGKSATDSETVKIVPAPVSVIDADPLVVAGRSGLMASVPEQADCTYLWTVVGGTITQGGKTPRLTYKAGTAGTVTLTCSVKNSAGSLAKSSKAVTVVKTLATIKAPTAVTTGLGGWKAAVPRTEGAMYDWSGTTGVVPDGDGTPEVTFTAGPAGSASLMCKVTLNGIETTGTKLVSVLPAPKAEITAAPKVTAGRASLQASAAVQPSCTYAWTLAGGRITAGASARTVTYTAGPVGTATLGCTVKNAAGTSDSASSLITVLAAPVAVITSEAKVTTGTTGHTASVPAHPDATFRWDITGGTLTGGMGTNTIEYEAGLAGPLSLKCKVTTGAGAVATGSKSVAIVARPIATLTAPATIVAGSTTNMASVPAQAGCTFAWSVTSGAAAILTGQGTRAITFSSSDTSFTLQCVVTNAAKDTATGVAEVKVFRTVSGTCLRTLLPFNASTGSIAPSRIPAPDSFRLGFRALLQDGTILQGLFDPDGTYFIPDVPGGHYWLHRATYGGENSHGENDYVWTNLTKVDWGYKWAGRRVEFAYCPVGVVFNTMGLSPWQAMDDLLFYDFNTNLRSEPLKEASAGFPAVGDTALNALTVDWYDAADQKLPLLDTYQRDAPLLVQMVSASMGSEQLRIAQRWYRPSPIQLMAGGLPVGATVGGVFTTPVTANVTVNYKRSEFSAYRNQYNPGRALRPAWIRFDALPGATTYGYAGRSLDNLYCANSDTNVTTDLNLGPVAVPVLPKGFQRIVYAGEEHSVDLLLPGCTTPWAFTGSLRSYSTTLPTATAPLKPIVSPVKNPTINGQDLFVAQMDVGESPTLAWGAPDLGTPQGYILRIYRLNNLMGRTVMENMVARLFVPGDETSITLPPGILAPDTYYCVQIRAFADSTYDPAKAPYGGNRFPFGFADALSGLIKR